MVISQIVFALFLATGVYFFAGSVGVIRRNIFLGKDIQCEYSNQLERKKPI
jgi:hypothetical protein